MPGLVDELFAKQTPPRKSLVDDLFNQQTIAGPGGSPESPIDEEPPDEEVRGLRKSLMNLTAGSGHATRELARKGYEVQDQGDYNLVVKSKQDGRWYRLDPTRFEPVKDTLDILGGASNLGAQLLGGAGGAVGGTAIGGPVGGFAGAVGGAATAAAAEETARTQLGSRVAGFEPPTGEEAKDAALREAGYAAAGEVLAPAVKPLFKIAGKALQLPYKAEQKVVDLISRGLGGAAEGAETPFRHFGKIKITEKLSRESADSVAKSMEEEATRIIDQLATRESLSERVAKTAADGAGKGGVDDVLRAIVDQRVGTMTAEKSMNDMAFEGKRLWYKWARQNARRTKGGAWDIADKNADKIFERLYAKRTQLAKDSMEEAIKLLKERQPGLSDFGAKKLFSEAESMASSEARASSSFEQASRMANESASSLGRETAERTMEMPARLAAKVEDQIGGFAGRGGSSLGRFLTERQLYRAAMPLFGYQFTSSPFGLWGGVRALNLVGKIVENTPQLLRRLIARAPAPIAGRLKPVIDALGRGDKTGAMMSLSLLLKNDAVRDWVEQNLGDAQDALSALPGLPGQSQ